MNGGRIKMLSETLFSNIYNFKFVISFKGVMTLLKALPIQQFSTIGIRNIFINDLCWSDKIQNESVAPLFSLIENRSAFGTSQFRIDRCSSTFDTSQLGIAKCSDTFFTLQLGIGKCRRAFGASQLGIGKCSNTIFALQLGIGKYRRAFGTSKLGIGKCRNEVMNALLGSNKSNKDFDITIIN